MKFAGIIRFISFLWVIATLFVSPAYAEPPRYSEIVLVSKDNKNKFNPANYIVDGLRNAVITYGKDEISAIKDKEAEKILNKKYKSFGKPERMGREGQFTKAFSSSIKKNDISAQLHTCTDGDRLDRKVRSQIQLAF